MLTVKFYLNSISYLLLMKIDFNSIQLMISLIKYLFLKN
jgi:hypothetical protein